MKSFSLYHFDKLSILAGMMLLFIFFQVQSHIKTSEAIPIYPPFHMYFFPTDINFNIAEEKQPSNLIMNMSGNFTNHQIQNGIVTWIQNGSWELNLFDHGKMPNQGINNTLVNARAIFNASFTMMKPDKSFSHTHLINNFVSNNIIFKDKSIFIKGIADIHSTIGMEFKQVPISLHIINKKILKISIDVGKTNWHFSEPNEIQGTIIKGIGLDNITKSN